LRSELAAARVAPSAGSQPSGEPRRPAEPEVHRRQEAPEPRRHGLQGRQRAVPV